MKAIITTTSRFMASDNRLYFRVSGKTAIGILKVGVKKLFIRTDMGQIKEISPLCVLDFYVHESAQRSGQGRVRSPRSSVRCSSIECFATKACTLSASPMTGPAPNSWASSANTST